MCRVQLHHGDDGCGVFGFPPKNTVSDDCGEMLSLMAVITGKIIKKVWLNYPKERSNTNYERLVQTSL